MDDDELQAWRDDLWDRYITLRDEMLHGTPLDFGAASLRAVQALVGDPIEDHVTMAVAAYVGEALLRVAGGGWGWEDEPFAVPDPALGLAPVNLFELIGAVVAGDEEPGWKPTKEETDLDDVDDLDPAAFTAWLAARAAAFRATSVFDFTAESLPAVEDMVVSAAPTKELLRSAEHRELYENATVLGELRH